MFCAVFEPAKLRSPDPKYQYREAGWPECFDATGSSFFFLATHPSRQVLVFSFRKFRNTRSDWCVFKSVFSMSPARPYSQLSSVADGFIGVHLQILLHTQESSFFCGEATACRTITVSFPRGVSVGQNLHSPIIVQCGNVLGPDIEGLKLNVIARHRNERPRKALDYETPVERLQEFVVSIR